ncbi:hypothetical protein AB0P37_50435 [Streptomyces antimycoticus]|uniref:hypothetical protein n=1 Tax=Streptomyces antimycoticus TaxID=68175 RepID=UPI0034198E53
MLKKILLRALAEMPFAQVAWELGEVLVGQGHGQPVAAGFGEHVLQRVGQGEEVVRLVHVQGRIDALVFGGAGAG